MPLPAFSAGHFQSINTQENAVVICLLLFISSIVGKVSVYGKKRPVTPSELWNNKRIKLTQRHQYSAKNV